ncbi:alcohol dehydrogenase catalytic domain-containing protein, partial [Acuticoccus kandeliae]|uniref:alcohol dehydrogenase catalytic domain-containing protein n=1 Tax=Acuticoccus kandeliae TaxID=2073160 RepID=UPI0013002B08
MESEAWCFDTFGPAERVMRRRHEGLPPPEPGEALVAIRAVGLNQAENRYLEGRHFPPAHLPAAIAHEAVGEIVALGAPGGGHGWSVGDRVALNPMRVDIAGMGALR